MLSQLVLICKVRIFYVPPTCYNILGATFIWRAILKFCVAIKLAGKSADYACTTKTLRYTVYCNAMFTGDIADLIGQYAQLHKRVNAE